MSLPDCASEKVVPVIDVAPRNVASVDQFEEAAENDFEEPHVKREKCNVEDRCWSITCKPDPTIEVEAEGNVDQIANETSETSEPLSFAEIVQEVLDKCPDEGDSERSYLETFIISCDPEGQCSQDG